MTKVEGGRKQMVAATLADTFGDRRKPRKCRGLAKTALGRFEGGFLGQGVGVVGKKRGDA